MPRVKPAECLPYLPWEGLPLPRFMGIVWPKRKPVISDADIGLLEIPAGDLVFKGIPEGDPELLVANEEEATEVLAPKKSESDPLLAPKHKLKKEVLASIAPVPAAESSAVGMAFIECPRCQGRIMYGTKEDPTNLRAAMAEHQKSGCPGKMSDTELWQFIEDRILHTPRPIPVRVTIGEEDQLL